ncbi:MAG: CPBP family intramembrane metalloprotease [Acidobacteria bacterium]|nr:CPBP family intramembrane metalloprotease [Acidobacteriota bacterium]
MKGQSIPKGILVTEFSLLYLILPLAYTLGSFRFSPLLPLALLTVLCVIILVRDSSFDRRRLTRLRLEPALLRGILGRYLLAIVVLTVGLMIWRPDMLLGFVRQRPLMWALVMVLYPLFSVYPQEILYRAFLFHRYRPLFSSEQMRVHLSAAAFALVHIIFLNPLALVLSWAGGYIFARTYQRSQSLLLVSLEHALYGCLIFTVGLGSFFYHGTGRY